ncbi:MAG: 30S ribosomal protein S6 [bacterium]
MSTTEAAQKYETVFICRPTLAEEKGDDMGAKVGRRIEKEKGTGQKQYKWGKRRLAYRIQGQEEGWYVAMEIEGQPKMLVALDGHFRVNEDILRHLTVKAEKPEEPRPPRRGEGEGRRGDTDRPVRPRREMAESRDLGR